MPAIVRLTAAVLATAGLGAGLTACGQSAAQNPIDAPAAPALTYNIANIDALAKDFPAGFTVNAGLSKTLSQEDVAGAGTQVLTEAQLNPAHCLPMILPTYSHPTVGTEAAGVIASGEQGGVQVTALRLPAAVPVGAAPAGCDRVTVSGPEVTGVAERVPSPVIDGVRTTGVKLLADGHDEPADYIYTAALGARTVIVVRSSLDDAVAPQRFLSNLLVKAVAAVRGR